MSRVAKNPVIVPEGVVVSITHSTLEVSGPLGKEILVIHSAVKVLLEGASIWVQKATNSELARALSGTFRALIQNIVTGVTSGFQKKLILFGTGYKAQLQGSSLILNLGYSHPVSLSIPSKIKVELVTPTELILRGSNKQEIGLFAANIRKLRPLEPYKGKGVRYDYEVVTLKEVKKK